MNEHRFFSSYIIYYWKMLGQCPVFLKHHLSLVLVYIVGKLKDLILIPKPSQLAIDSGMGPWPSGGQGC